MNASALLTFHQCTLGEMPRMQSHQAKNEIFEFLKNYFSMALATSLGILKCVFQALDVSETITVTAFLKPF